MDEPQARIGGWSAVHRIVFRFVFSYLMLCVLPFPFGYLPGSMLHTNMYDRMWFTITTWVATHILHIAPSPPYFADLPALIDATNGYIALLCFLVLAALTTIAWTLLDRNRAHYRTLHDWFRTYVRYALGCTMLAYGMDKVFALQFSWSLPGPERLAEPLGNYSPFALVWTFMGYSTGYTIFSGAGEVIGGLLLFFRRTTTLGALIICGVMANVVALNFCYGVPVKIFSSTLLVQAIFLLAPDVKRLLDVFVLNRPVPALNLDDSLPREWMRIPRAIVHAALVVFSLYWFAGPALRENRLRANPPKSPIYGLYQVDSFTQDGKPIPPGDANWRRVIFEGGDAMTVITMDDSMQHFGTNYESAKNVVTISGEVDSDSHQNDQSKKGVLAYSRPDPGHLELRGNLNGRAVVIEMRTIDTSKFTLVSRGFHWNEDGGFYR